jgi:hypothetical protein
VGTAAVQTSAATRVVGLTGNLSFWRRIEGELQGPSLVQLAIVAPQRSGAGPGG